MSASLRRIIGEGTVCVCGVLSPREVEEKKHSKKCSTLLSSYHDGLILLGRGPAPIQSSELMWGNINTPHPCLLTTDWALTKRHGSISILTSYA